MFHNVKGEYRAAIALKWFATESCIQLIQLACPEITKIAQFFMAKCRKSRIICYAKNVKNHAILMEKICAGGRFMKYSMSVFMP